MDARTIALALAFTLIGGLIGRVYCLLLRRAVARLVRDKGGVGRFLLFMGLRVLLFGAGLCGALYAGVFCVIGYAVGFAVVRTIAVRSACVTPAARGAQFENKLEGRG